MILTALILLALCGLAYIRLAPSHADIWHKMPTALEEGDKINSAARRINDTGATLEQLDGIIGNTPRTTRLAGSVDEGMVTYVTRTPLMGYPDYTTVKQDGSDVLVWGRSRFGRSDLGVNRKRLEGWLAQLGQD